MTEENKIPVPSEANYSSRWLGYGWLIVTLILLILVLKPYNKAHKNANSTQYSIEYQNDTAAGYTVDYNGVVDFVAFPNGQSVSELVIKEQSVYKLGFSNKNKAFNTIQVFKNGIEIDSFSVASKHNISLQLYTNDRLKIVVASLDASNPEVAVKLQRDNSIVQRGVYYVLVIWLIIGMWLVVVFGGIHIVLPSILLILACYNEHLYEPETWMLPMFGFVGLTVLFTDIRYLLSKSRLRIFSKLLVLIYDYVLIIGAILLMGFIWNYKRFGYRLDHDTIIALLQTNVSEGLEFGLSELDWVGMVVIIVAAIIPLGLWIISRSIKPKKIKLSHFVLVIVATILGYTLQGQSQFIGQIKSAYTQYYQEIKKFNEVQKLFKNPENIEATKTGKGETYVIVIGESQSKENMSVYGYHRKTTPFLDSLNATGQLQLFENAYSSHTHTIMVLRDALTQANQYNGLDFTSVPSLINVLNAADFETVWLSNQVKLSNWDNIVSAIAVGCEKQIFVNKNIGEAVKNSPYDERVLPELEKLLSTKTDKNRVVFVHLLGNHGRYVERYPKTFKGIPSKGVADYGSQPDIGIWEAYDNSIKYNDSIVSVIYDLVNSYGDKPSLVAYFADHAEDLSGNRGHNAGQFTYRMTQIPMFIWANKEYKTTYADQWSNIQLSKEKRFSNDLFFQLALGMMQVKTPLYDARYDVSNAEFLIDTFKTKEGKLLYDAVTNPYTSFAKNMDSIRSWNMTGRIGMHRVNTLGKANEVIVQGGKVIEIDAKYVEGNLMVGHGEDNAMAGISLKTFFANIDIASVSKLWLELKNLDDLNLIPVMKELEELDSIYRLKDKMIVETRYQGVRLGLLSKKGFKTCFYITDELTDDPRNRKGLAASRLWVQLRNQEITGVSFDASLYPLVQESLGQMLPNFIDFHTWNIGLDARHGNFIEKLKAEPYFNHRRVKTILVSFPSVFEL